MLIAQLTDLHIRADGALCHGIGDSSGGLRMAVDHIMQILPKPDVVLITGDLTDDESLEGYRKVRAELDRLDIPVFVVPGNHDDCDRLRFAFPDHTYLPDRRPLHYVIDAFPLRLIGLDTTIPNEIGGRLCETDLQWLDERLGERPDRPALVFMHHPPIATGIAGLDLHAFDGVCGLKHVLARHSHVEALIGGHVHRTISKTLGRVPVLTSPATSYQFTLDLAPHATLTAILEPAGFLVHAWSTDDGLTTHTSFIDAYAGPVPLGP